MAGLVFPDVAGSVLPALQIQKSQQLMDLEAARQRKLDADQARLDSAGQYVGAAVNGDPEAAANLARTNPGLFTQVQTLISNRDDKKLKQAQENAKWLAGASGAVLEAPQEERATAYAQHLAELKARGIDASNMPQTYSPAVDAYLRYHLNSGVSADKYLETHLKQPGVLPDGGAPPVAPGGAPASPGGTGSAGNAIAGIESQGQPNGGYGAIGPAANKDGNRAYGKYQVMDFNIPTWTKEVLGEPMTPQQFLANPQAQDAVFNAKFGQYTQKYGPEGAARAWFGGEGGMNNPNAKDVNGMTVANYGNRFAAAGGGAPMPAMAGGPPSLGAPQGAMVNPGYVPPGGLPSVPPVGPPQQPGGPDLQAQALARLLPKAPQFGQGPQPNGMVPGMPVGGDQPPVNQPGVMPPPQTAPPPIQTLHDYVASVMPGAKLVGNMQTGEPLYNHDGYIAVQLPNGQRTFIPPPLKPQQPPAGYRPGANGNLEAIPGGPADLGRGINGIDKSITGPAVYQALMDNGDAGKAAEIKGIVEGRLPLPSAQSRVPNAVATRQLAFQADPDLTDATHAQRMKTLTDLNSGKPNTAGYQLQAQGTLFNHLAEAVDENQKILNSPYPLVNRALNAVGMAEGDPRLAAINVTLGKVNAEGEKAFEGKTTVSGLAKAAEDLKATMGTPAFAAAARAYMTLVNGQQTQLLGRVNRGLGYKPGDPRAITQDNPEILTPDARESRDRILAQTQPNSADNSTLMDKGKQIFGAKAPPQLGPPAPQQQGAAPPGSLPMPQKTTGADGPRLSPEQAAQLPPGTPFIGLDGLPRTRN